MDRTSNKLFERHLHAETRSHLYQPRDMSTAAVDALGYDSIDRLRQYQRGQMNDGTGGGQGTNPGAAISTAISLPNAKTQQDYALDGLGNWKNTAFTPVGDSQTLQRRDHNYLNQITATKDDSDPKAPFSYDGLPGASSGNLTNDGLRGYVYDALNRLVIVNKTPAPAAPTLIAAYTYDAMGRRIRKVVINGGLSGTIPNGTTDFTYTGWRCVEERDGSNAPTRQYVWGIYIDELIQQKNLVALNNFDAGDELYALQDMLYRNTGLADDAGSVRECYDCDAYGNTLIFRNSGSPPTAITYTNSDMQVEYPTCDALFTGQRYDAETDIYCYKARQYVPQLGRLAQRDLMSSVHLYQFCSSTPVSRLDPSGDQDLKTSYLNPRTEQPGLTQPYIGLGERYLMRHQFDKRLINAVFTQRTYWGIKFFDSAGKPILAGHGLDFDLNIIAGDGTIKDLVDTSKHALEGLRKAILEAGSNRTVCRAVYVSNTHLSVYDKLSVTNNSNEVVQYSPELHGSGQWGITPKLERYVGGRREEIDTDPGVVPFLPMQRRADVSGSDDLRTLNVGPLGKELFHAIRITDVEFDIVKGTVNAFLMWKHSDSPAKFFRYSGGFVSIEDWARQQHRMKPIGG